MNKLKSRNKICFQNNKNIHSNIKLSKLNKTSEFSGELN